MALNEDDIRRMFAGLLTSQAATVLGTVTEIDEINRTCTLDDDGVPLPGVRLQAITGGDKGVLIVPVTGALALAVKVESSEDWMLLDCSEIEKIIVKVGSSTVQIADNLIQCNNGTNGGMINIQPMISWMFNVYTDLQAIATALKTIAPVQPVTPLPVRENFEDTLIIH